MVFIATQVTHSNYSDQVMAPNGTWLNGAYNNGNDMAAMRVPSIDQLKHEVCNLL